MFTDGPTTPLRVEALLTLVREMGRRAQRDTLRAVFQPHGLDRKGDSSACKRSPPRRVRAVVANQEKGRREGAAWPCRCARMAAVR